jgi:RNA polymerase sigma-70 factor (ECF subfamily)
VTTAAFNLLFEEQFEPLTRFVTRMVRSRHVAAELVQDVFLRLWRGRRELYVRGDIRSYLRRAARNRALDWLRREELHHDWERTAVHEMETIAAPSDDDKEGLLHDLLSRALAGMPARRREVCELRWREGLGPIAIAEQLRLSVKTVETHITAGIKELRAAVLG